MSPRLPSFRLSASILALSTVVHSAPLLTDNFNDANTDASTFNNNLASTQTGPLAPLTYSTSAPGGGYTVQHGNGGRMLVVDNAGIPSGRASLNRNFAIEANLANKPLSISFNIAEVTHSTDPTIWGHFGLGSTQNADYFGTDFSILIRSNGAWNARDNNAGVDRGTGTYADGDLITFVFSDSAGTGSAFNGNGSQVTIKVGASSPVSYPLNQLSAADGFLTWGGFSFGEEFMLMAIDNLSVDMDASFPANEALTWSGAVDADWNETTANWTNVNSFTRWYNNPSNPNSVVFDATGLAQPAVNLAQTHPLLAGTITFDTAGYSLVGGPLTLGNSPTFTANADATITTALQGGAGLTKNGAATLSLTGSNSYSGVTTLAAGVLNAASFSDFGIDSSLGNRAADSGPGNVGLLFRGGTLQYTGATAQSTNRGIRLSTTGGGGTIDASGSDPAATLSFTATTSPDFFENPGSRTLTLTGSNPGDNTFAIAIGDAGGSTSLVKDGPGKWILTGANTYTGSTTVNAGTLALGSPFLENLSSVTLGSGAVLDLAFTGNDIIGSLDINGSGPLPGGLYNSSHPTYGSFFTGSGSLLVLNGANGIWTSTLNGVWDDTANWQSGTIASGFDQSATFNAATGVTVSLTGSQTIGSLVFDVSDYVLAGPSTLTLDASSPPSISVGSGRSATISANLAGTFGLDKTGDGTLVFTGSKSYSGLTTVSGGTLELAGATTGNAQIHGSVLVSPGATLAFTGGDGTGFGFFNNPVTATTVDGGTIDAVSGSHLGFGPFQTMTLQSGGTLLGNWQWNGDSQLGFSSSGDDTNTIGGTLNLRNDDGANHTFVVDDGASATDLLVSGTFAGSGSIVVKDGAGTMTLTGANTHTGNTVVNAGSLEVTAAGSLRFRPTTNGTSNAVSGSASAALSFLGTVNLDLSAANTSFGNSWNLFNLGSFTGPAPTLAPAAVTSSLGAFSEVTPGTWELPVPGAKWVFTPGDGNLAYVAAATDYDTWADSFSLVEGPSGDDDKDGVSNDEEYAFGLLPNNGSSVSPITAQLDKSTGTFSYTRRDMSLTDLAYSVWYSTDLGTWIEDGDATEGLPVLNGEVETVEVTINPALLANPKLFVQVRAN